MNEYRIALNSIALRLVREQKEVSQEFKNNLPVPVLAESSDRASVDARTDGGEARESTDTKLKRSVEQVASEPRGGQFISDEEVEAELQQDAEDRDAGLTRYTESGGIE